MTRLAQSVERRTFNPVVEGSSPSSGGRINRALIVYRFAQYSYKVLGWVQPPVRATS